MSLMRVSPRGWLGAMLLAATLGCGGSGETLIPVSGSVAVDGQPAEGVVLLFHGGNGVSTATSDVSGSFSTVTNGESGMPAGSYKVTASWPEPIKFGSGGMGETPDSPDRLGGAFMVLGQSKISVEVSDSTTKLPPIELSTK
ncbi:MAG: hypothetical protein O2946_07070 [Planctomycetota bacterium]|nr:hypothetical protein [Planctomycetota bacterium]